jgi:hypothetical protein
MEIQDFNNYIIYEDGKVFSKKSNKFLKHLIDKYGYSYVRLYKDNKQNFTLVHRLVATHYIPNPNNLPEVDHINRDRSDNRVQNLRWSSHLDNCNNRGKRNDNTSGHKGILYHKKKERWAYQKTYHKKRIQKHFKTKTEALCFKYIVLLKIKSGLY